MKSQYEKDQEIVENLENKVDELNRLIVIASESGLMCNLEILEIYITRVGYPIPQLSKKFYRRIDVPNRREE